MTKVFIICRDRLTDLQKLVEWLEKYDVEICFVDNHSTYPPLIQYYRSTPHRVFKVRANRNHRAPWTQGLVPLDERYIVTDPDVVPKETVPGDWLDVMNYVLDERPDVSKVGFGLEINDIPDHYAAKAQVERWEGALWGNRNDVGQYQAHDVPVDTTFALYREGTTVGQYESPSDLPAIRLGEPYVARHMAWYIDSANPTEEDLWYQKRADSSISNWRAQGASKSHGGTL